MPKVKKIFFFDSGRQQITCEMCGRTYVGSEQKVELLMTLHIRKSHEGERRRQVYERISFDGITQKVSKNSELHEALYSK